MLLKKSFLLMLTGLLACGLFISACNDNASENTDGDVDQAADGDTDVVVTDGDKDTAVDGDTTDSDQGGIIIYPDGDDDDESDRIVGCLEDSDCSGGDYCDTASGLCKRRKSICEVCTTNQECGYQGDVCLKDTAADAGICGYYCEDATDCDTGFSCEAVAGVSSKQCIFQGQDNAGSTGDSCCADVHCQAPLVCHPLTSKCYDGCKGDGTSACPPGQVCVDDSTDDRNGHCKEGCDEETPCDGGTVCVDGTCIEGDCAIKEHCPIEYLCNTATNRCVAGCEVQEDCYTSNECINGTCVERVGCTGTRDCKIAEVCTIEVPLSESGDIAVEDRGCCYNPKTSGTEECPNPGEPVKLCDVCTDTQNQSNPPECGQGSLGKNYCVTLQDKDENPIGDFCMIRWDCSVRVDGELDKGTQTCPRGYTCAKIDQGNEMDGKYCMADCTDSSFQ